MRRNVIILGMKDLQKELLCQIIEEKLEVKCSVVRNIDQSSGGKRHSSGQQVVLVDHNDMHAEELLTDLKYLAKDEALARIIALYNIAGPGTIEREAILRGVRGFFYRQDTIELLCRGIEALFKGEIWLSREILSDLVISNDRPTQADGMAGAVLTQRESEVLARVAIGWTNDEISARLNISTHTVKTHLYRIYKKIHVDNRFQASLWAAKNL